MTWSYPSELDPVEACSYPFLWTDRCLSVSQEAAVYHLRKAEESILYGVVVENLETILSPQWERDRQLPRFVEPPTGCSRATA